MIVLNETQGSENVKSTKELLHILESAKSLNELEKFTNELSSMNSFSSFHEYINSYIAKKNIIPAELIQASLIQRNYGYQILNGTKHPGKDKIIALCLSLKLTVEEAQRALSLANECQLYAKKRRDSIIIFALNNQLSVIETNELLHDCLLYTS